MEIRTWHVKDIYFNDDERDKVERHIQRLESSGWVNDGEDIGTGEFEYCVQLKK